MPALSTLRLSFMAACKGMENPTDLSQVVTIPKEMPTRRGLFERSRKILFGLETGLVFNSLRFSSRTLGQRLQQGLSSLSYRP